jgi:hypothetical protein
VVAVRREVAMIVVWFCDVISETGDSATINAILAIDDRQAKPLDIYDIVDSADDPESRAGRMLGWL